MSRETAPPSTRPAGAAVAAGARASGGSDRASGLRGNLGALRHPLYRRYWLGSLGSVGGTQFVTLASGWLVVFELGGSPLDLGYIGGATAAPTIVVNLFGGVLADRMNRRRLLLATSLLTALLLGLLAALDAGGAVAIGHVVAISAALGLVYGVDWPVRNAFFPQLIEHDQMISAVALNSMWQATRIVSPAIGGVAIAIFGTAFVIAAGALGFAAMFLVLLTLDIEAPPSTARREVLRELADSVAYIARTRLFAALILLTYATSFFGFAYVFLMPLMAVELDVGSASLGFLYSMLGIGAVSGTLLTFRLQRVLTLGRITLGGSIGSSLFILAFALSPAYPLSVALVFGAGLCNSMFMITSMTALQLRVPDALRGRVMGIHSITFSLIALGGLFGGAVANASDVRVAVALGALLLAASTLTVALTQPEVRRLRAPAAAASAA